MNEIWFTAVGRFDSRDGENWQKYCSWSGLNQLNRLISLDCILCPPILDELVVADWDHNVQRDGLIYFFRDRDYLRLRVKELNSRNILAASLNPDIEQADLFEDRRFSFCGYDLVEVGGGVSALVNCGGFPKSFDNSELNNDGLLDTLERAMVVQNSLQAEYPEEIHAYCDIWGLWLMEPST